LEWVGVDDETAKRLLDAPQLAKYRHYLAQKRVWKPHYLSEPEEKVLDEKAITGKAAFVRLFDETVSALQFTLRREEKRMQQVLSELYAPEREMRAGSAASLTEGLKGTSRLLTYILNTLVLEHRSDCTLRKHSDVMAPRNLANEIDGKVVNALMSAAEG